MARDQRKDDFVSAFFRERPVPEGSPVIDDRTWGDLDMEAVFQKVDRTQSSVGQACLYDMLRRPLFDAEAMAARVRKVEALLADDRTRWRIDKVLARLGVQREGEIFRYLSYMRTRIEDRKRYLYLALAGCAVLSILGVIFLHLTGLAFLALMAVVNLVIHYRFKARVTVESPTFEYMHKLLVAGDKLAALALPSFEKELEELRGLSRTLAKIRKRTVLLSTPGGLSGDMLAIIWEYISAFFLQEVIAYFFVHNTVIRSMAELIRVYNLVGTVDALASVATLRREERGLVVPEWVSGGLLVDVEDMVHPLLAEPVPNSVRLEGKGLLITGSNMSGKSTFLRTLGVNQILATTVCVAFARKFRVTPLLAITSITNRDNILASESHYLVEAKRLLDILAAAKSSHPALVIIDEILSGTNSEERIAASIGILRHLSALNCLVVAATHDRQIALALSEAFGNLHFTHLVDGEGLEFDYKLRDGIVEHGNAIKLLRLLGYPSEILDTI
jgi:DNA mismatch repair ATPase MutS